MSIVKRRDFLKKVTIGSLAGGSAILSACATPESKPGAPGLNLNKTFEWRMVTTWQPHFPVLGEGADNVAKWIEKMSGGRLKIQVYGGSELVPALEAFDAVSQGIAEMGHGASYYWAGKTPAAQFFAAVPFGMNAQQMNAWILEGGGLKLWEEVYAPFNLIPFPAGNTGVQMGGWFNRDINSISDLKGLKMRIPGLGGKVIAKAGGSAVLSAGGEIYTNLERGVIDATEWVGPYHDYLMGFHKIARNYYYPGWHEPGTVIEMFVNRSAYEGLPEDLQHIVRSAAYRATGWMISAFEARNNEYLEKIKKESNVTIKPFPVEVLNTFRKYSAEVIEEITSSDQLSKRIYESFSSFKSNINAWSELAEKAYYTNLNR